MFCSPFLIVSSFPFLLRLSESGRQAAKRNEGQISSPTVNAFCTYCMDWKAIFAFGLIGNNLGPWGRREREMEIERACE